MLFLLVIGTLYFIPGIVAAFRHAKHQVAIVIVNLLFGWTILGWLGGTDLGAGR